MRIAFAVLALAGCASSYRSAHTLAPGHTQISAAVTRAEALDDEGDDDGSGYIGELRVARGLHERVDGSVHLARAPGSGTTASLLALEPRFQLTERHAPIGLSIGVPVGLIWAEESENDDLELDLAAYVLAPAVYVGFELSPVVELVVAPKLFVFIPDDDAETEVELGGSVGLRITDAMQTWAVHPEIGLLRLSEGDDSESYLTLGLSISAGD